MQHLYNARKGETCLIIGNGPGLGDIPLDILRHYDSVGANLITRLPGFIPTWYVAVDRRVYREHRSEIETRLPSVPKFLPSPDLDEWDGDNVYHFHHRPGPLWLPFQGAQHMTRPGIAYQNVTHACLLLAFWLGYRTMLTVGLDNTTGAHFYGEGETGGDPQAWNTGYGELHEDFKAAGRNIINISTRTGITTLPRDDWRQYG